MRAPPAAARRGRVVPALFAAYCAAWLLLAIDPWYQEDWLLENVLVFVAVPLLVAGWFRATLGARFARAASDRTP